MGARVIGERHGFPGALRALGGGAGHVGAPEGTRESRRVTRVVIRRIEGSAS